MQVSSALAGPTAIWRTASGSTAELRSIWTLSRLYADAIPVHQLKREQERLKVAADQAEQQLAAAEASVVEVEEILGKALDLLEHCEGAYEVAPGPPPPAVEPSALRAVRRQGRRDHRGEAHRAVCHPR
jgi:hypothetical protein